MNIQQTIEDRLWDYIDDTCSFNEKKIMKKSIATKGEWIKKYHELTGIHELISESFKLDEPSPGFLQRVMGEIAAIK